ncbi:MAG: DUF1178 family protein [Betaproteobacteria bacterium]|nr:DUF1178 family protein [Betaproteobacteria bacterium]
MIVINLSCSKGHPFEGWFASNDEFTRQWEGGELVCPFCGDHQVSRLPSAPRIRRHGASQQGRKPVGVGEKELAIRSFDALARIVEHIIAESEDVGERFAVEARRIHGNEAPQRSIRGRSTVAEAVELLEEGIAVLPLPVPPTGEMH